MKAMTLIQRWFGLSALAIALSSCNPTEPENAIQTVEPQIGPQADVKGSSASSQTQAPNAIANTSENSRDGESNNNSDLSPEPPGADTSQPTNPALSSSQASAGKPITHEPKQQAPEAQAAAIKIDATVCGAGGQEAYFETKRQEIYICKNETDILTYIATPKQGGNSMFLPAHKIQQGKIIGYAAIEDAKTYIVTSAGLQVQENGRAVQSEKVIGRQLDQAQ